MRELVLDASVLAKWFHNQGETAVEAALRLRDEYDAGGLMVVVPPLLLLELLNLAVRRWAASEAQLLGFARHLQSLRFTLLQPALERVARWTGTADHPAGTSTWLAASSIPPAGTLISTGPEGSGPGVVLRMVTPDSGPLVTTGYS